MLKWKRPPWAVSPAEAGVQSPHVSADGLMSALRALTRLPPLILSLPKDEGDAVEGVVLMPKGLCLCRYCREGQSLPKEKPRRAGLPGAGCVRQTGRIS